MKRRLESRSPFSQQVTHRFDYADTLEIDECIKSLHEGYHHWSGVSLESRAEVILRVAEKLDQRKEALARIMSFEMGKLIGEARAEIEKCIWVCHYYAENGPDMLENQEIKTEAGWSGVVFRPLGIVFGVMPWNFPFWQVFRFAIPSIMAGNTVLVKHASNVPRCALSIEAIFTEVYTEKGLYLNAFVHRSDVEHVVADPAIAAVTLTGSEDAGRAVASLAGKHLKKSVMELGGSDPYVICADADLAHAVEQCVKGRMLNAGQSCIGAKRFIVHASVYDQFLTMLEEKMKAHTMGDPLDEETILAPLASVTLRDELHEQVRRSVELGAEVLIGGKVDTGQPAAFYPPTILTNIPKESPAFKEELFGPVASVFKFSTMEEAVALANATQFGLGAAIFSADTKMAETFAREGIQAGAVFVNAMVRSDPRLPFGGIKNSGYGRELSLWGIREFTNVKTIYIDQS